MPLNISDMVGYGPVAFAGVLRSKAHGLRAEADDLDRIAAALEGQHRRASATGGGAR